MDIATAPDPIAVALSAALVGQSALAATLVFARSPRRPVYLFLTGFFIVNAVTDAGPVALSLGSTVAVHLAVLGIPALLTGAPCLWFYVVGLTAETDWSLAPRDLRHFLPALLGLLTAVLVAALPLDSKQQLLEGNLEAATAHPFFALMAYVLMTLAGIVQIGLYIPAIVRRLVVYRRRLRDVFASTEHLELRWLSWLVLIVGGYWLVTLASVVAELGYGVDITSETVEAAIALAIVWVLSIWGLRQQPGFISQFDHHEAADTAAEAVATRKYERSALAPEQSRRIADKIAAAMGNDHLYRDPNLSLRDLSAHVAVTPNYVSQTLNETIGQCFFDYVNHWRIGAAKARVLKGEETILDIAFDVGFNSRSSFYTAFKRETGMTPTAFRGAAGLAS
ncbi:MAG: helix-turn-helix transcriptional regulator [Pseudomonadales bacterium]|nr:helix-turn-helix transcriptional regulator [Pseudomonadales bacterium]